MSCFEHFMQTLSHHPCNDVAITDTRGVSLNYGELVTLVNQTADWMNDYPAVGVAVMLDNGPTAIICDLALMASQHWSLPIPPFFSVQQTSHALHDSGCQYLLTTSKTPHELLGTYKLVDDLVHMYRLPPSKRVRLPKGTKKISYTSGSTGTPKGLCFSTNQLLGNVIAVAETLSFTPPFRYLSLLPWPVLLENVAGYYACLYIGATCIAPSLTQILSDSTTYNFAHISELVSQYHTNGTIMVPDLLRQYCHYVQTHSADTSSWDFIAVGGATVPASLHAMCNDLNLPVYEGYGLSEAASVTSLNSPDACVVGTVGKLLSPDSVNIASDGEIFLKEASFLGTTGSSTPPPAPFPTGDLGTLDSDGYLRVLGRKKSIIITGMGRNIAPEWLESELLGVDGMQQAFVYANEQNELEALIVCSESHLPPDTAAINAMLALPAYAKINQFFKVGPFTIDNELLTRNGKLNRSKLLAFAQSRPKRNIAKYANYSRC